MSVSRKKVLVGMSGGVDSSVVALLLQKQGYQVIGAMTHYWHPTLDNASPEQLEAENKCCSNASLADARAVARTLGIPFFTINARAYFKKTIVDPFIEEQRNLITPNPCVTCNQKVKFGIFLEKACEINADYVATGHYAGITRGQDGVYHLHRGHDQNKDQSYFMWKLSQQQLAHILFPLAKLTKPEVRAIAQEAGLINANRRDSQALCFMPGKDSKHFVRSYLGDQLKTGDIIDQDGRVLGQHEGLHVYTIGQRRGVNIGGTGPYYVVGFNRVKNQLLVTNKTDDARLFQKHFFLAKQNWLAGVAPALPMQADVKVRYGKLHTPTRGTITVDRDCLRVTLEEPIRAVTPGQSAVFYDQDKVLGGGVIMKAAA